MEYALLEADSSFRLEAYVNMRIDKGWRVQGGVSVFWNASGWCYTQAMVRGDANPT
jgi:hypothetical protein